jgi:5-methylcytosine-specific restriction endonuclease McrA
MSRRRRYGINVNSARKRYLKERIIERDGSACMWCGREYPPERLTLEHIRERSQGGTDAQDNLGLACEPCNQDRSNHPILKWIGARQRRR